MLPYFLFVLLFSTIALVIVHPPGRTQAGGRPTLPQHGQERTAVPMRLPQAPAGLYRGDSAAVWAARYRARTRQLQSTRALLHRRWAPTVDYALRLAASVFGVSYWQLRSVAWCESHHYPYARNGRYAGIFQLSWRPFGFSPFDPVASALSTAATVSREGWRQWECRP